MLRVSSVLIIAILSLHFGSVTVQADQMNWGDFAGTDVNFIDVTESTTENGLLYEQPSVIDNSLLFLPPNFASTSTNGATHQIEGLLTFTVTAMGNGTFNSIKIGEFGSYFDSGVTSTSEVTMDVSVLTANGLFSDSFTFTNVGDNSGDWEGELKMLFPGTNSAFFTLNNILVTDANVDGAAFIGKKGIMIDVANVAIPEPTCVGIVALAGVVLLSRRRKAVV